MDNTTALPVLWGRYASPFVRRVAVTLHEYAIDYHHESLMPFGPDKLRLAGVNPIARVPALQLSNHEVLVDSAVIIDYLDELAGPDRALTPRSGAPRRQVLTSLAVALGANEKLVAGLYERHFRPRELWHKPWLDACDQQVADGFKWLDEQCHSTWFGGAQMSQADITIAVFWLFGSTKRPGFFAKLQCRRLEALAARMALRPSFLATQPEPEPLTKLS